MSGNRYKVACPENDYIIDAEEFKVVGEGTNVPRYEFYQRLKLVASFPFEQVEGIYLEDDE